MAYDAAFFARFHDPFELIERMELEAQQVLTAAVDACTKSGTTPPENWPEGSPERAATIIAPMAFYARLQLQPGGDPHRVALWIGQLTLAWCALQDAIENRTSGIAASRKRTTPGASANARKWEAHNTPMYVEAVAVIREAGYQISATACADQVCGSRDAGHVRKLLIKRGLFRRRGGASKALEYVPDQTRIDEDFPMHPVTTG